MTRFRSQNSIEKMLHFPRDLATLKVSDQTDREERDREERDREREREREREMSRSVARSVVWASTNTNITRSVTAAATAARLFGCLLTRRSAQGLRQAGQR